MNIFHYICYNWVFLTSGCIFVQIRDTCECGTLFFGLIFHSRTCKGHKSGKYLCADELPLQHFDSKHFLTAYFCLTFILKNCPLLLFQQKNHNFIFDLLWKADKGNHLRFGENCLFFNSAFSHWNIKLCKGIWTAGHKNISNSWTFS